MIELDDDGKKVHDGITWLAHHRQSRDLCCHLSAYIWARHSGWGVRGGMDLYKDSGFERDIEYALNHCGYE